VSADGSDTKAVETSAETSLDTTAEKQARFLEAYESLYEIKAAAEAVGIHRATFYDWFERDETFRKRFAVAKTNALDALKGLAYKKAKDGSDRWLAFMLERLAPEEFGDRKKLELSGPGGQPLPAGAVAVTASDIKALNERIEAAAKAAGGGE